MHLHELSVRSCRLHSTIQYNTIQYSTVQYNTIQYSTIQYNTIQYNIVDASYVKSESEAHIKDQLLSYLLRNNLISKHQHGYLSNHSTTTNLSNYYLHLCTIATLLIHCKIDYCNSLLLNLPATQTDRLQLVLNSAARAALLFITSLLLLFQTRLCLIF